MPPKLKKSVACKKAKNAWQTQQGQADRGLIIQRNFSGGHNFARALEVAPQDPNFKFISRLGLHERNKSKDNQGQGWDFKDSLER